MSDIYKIEIMDGICIVRFAAAPSFEQAKEAITEVSQFPESKRRIYDLSNGLDLSTSELATLAEHGKTLFTEPSRVAIVASEDLAYGLARMESAYREDGIIDQATFRTESEALDWLSLRDKD